LWIDDRPVEVFLVREVPEDDCFFDPGLLGDLPQLDRRIA
jgi:hypothetical protein